ncbi:hypothetical protein QUF90_22730 [Desulfococcaceae bacterium HSG9]|nr:hypothetical protein [Desulfococcaceae bacterium HSG9]
MNDIKLILIFLLIVLLNSFTGCKQTLLKSDSDLKVKIEPDVKELTIGEESQRIKLKIMTDGSSQKFDWHLKGPGKLIGDTAASDIIYEVPMTLNSKEAEVQIILTPATDQKKQNIPPYPIRFKLRNADFATAVIETDEPIDNSDEMSHLENDFEKLRASGIDTQEKIAKVIKIADQCYENYVYATFKKISDDNEISKWQNLHIKIVDYLIPELIKQLDNALEQYRKQIRSDHLIKNKAIDSLNDSLAIIDNILKIYARNIDNDAQLNEKVQELKQKKEQIIKIIKIINDKK